MVSFTILAGGYTSFIATYLFDASASTLSLVSQSNTGQNPSWIASHPTNKSILYATNEDYSGQVESFVVSASGAVTSVSSAYSGGSNPAFLAPLSTGQVAIMNYNTGNGQIVPTTADALHFDPTSTITFPAPVSNPHMAYEYESEIFVPDLGADRIWRLGTSDNVTWSIHGEVIHPTGSGPRHMQIYSGNLYVLHELTSHLTAQVVPAAPNGTTTITSNVTIVPDGGPAGAVWAGGEVLIPPPSTDFPTPYIYASNRNTGVEDSRGDSIAIFISNTTPCGPELVLVSQVYTGLSQIRGMEFGGPNNEYLVAAGVAGNAGVAVFQRIGGGSDLQLLARNTAVTQRSSFVWL